MNRLTKKLLVGKYRLTGDFGFSFVYANNRTQPSRVHPYISNSNNLQITFFFSFFSTANTHHLNLLTNLQIC
ncbi:hypothetical protein HanRHA438_Chr04g0175091 [Helianthus annuus]|nr:hypothetical protein HanRHA438_Chr04g0175091 [Helianthus annuus]